MESSSTKLDLSVFKLMGDQNEEVCFVYDLQAGQFLYLNAAFEQVWKRSHQQTLENPAFLLETVYPDDRPYVQECYQKFLENPVKTGLSFRIEWPYTIDRWINLNVFPLQQNGDVNLVAGIAEDDSARKKNIFTMQKINARKDSMLEILAHDLRGPIGIVHSLAAILEEDLPEAGDGQSREQLQMIQRICKRNIDLIRDLVHQEFLESAQIEIDKARVDLVWEIKEVIKNYRSAQGNLLKVFELTAAQDQVYAQVDSMKFMQVINNLISNAIKFTHSNGHIQIEVGKSKSGVLISVKDNGVGIPDKVQPFLFDKFTRARRPGLLGEETVGLGMSIIKTIVDMHQGKIWFESKEHKGTTFHIQLPAEKVL